MKEVTEIEITQKVVQAINNACHDLNDFTVNKLNKAYEKETNHLAKEILKQILDNQELSKKERIPMCQDTGIVTCFVEIGYDVHINGDLYNAINEGVRIAYDRFYLRKSVASPISRENTNTNTPAIIHTSFVKGDNLKITLAPKGAGSENMSRLLMMNPTDGIKGIKEFVCKAITEAGGKPCPPIFIGLGIGGNFEMSCILAKKALLRESRNIDPMLASLEEEILNEVNMLGVGPMGLGGDTTCLDVFINTECCHIASMPVAINIQCHANRHVEVIL